MVEGTRFMKTNEQKQQKVTYTGQVISDRMDKTVVVKTERTYTHPKFHKIMRISKKYKVHDEHEVAALGDTIEFCEGRPVSKTKHMYLMRVIQKG